MIVLCQAPSCFDKNILFVDILTRKSVRADDRLMNINGRHRMSGTIRNEDPCLTEREREKEKTRDLSRQVSQSTVERDGKRENPFRRLSRSLRDRTELQL